MEVVLRRSSHGLKGSGSVIGAARLSRLGRIKYFAEVEHNWLLLEMECGRWLCLVNVVSFVEGHLCDRHT